MTIRLTPARGWIAELRDWLRHLCYAGLFFYFLTTYGYQSFQVEGVSMMPLLHDGERIFVNRYIYHFESIERGDVVVFWYPPAPVKTLVKRVIAVPGDVVSIREGLLYLNQAEVAEPYIPAEYRSSDNLPAVTVPPGYYFVLGDHRKNSDDSRRFGLVPQRYVLGRVALRFWPKDSFGVIPHERIEVPVPAGVEPAPVSTAPVPPAGAADAAVPTPH